MLNLPAPTLTAPHHSSTSRLQQQQNPREKPSAAPSLFPSSIALTPDFLVQCAEGTAVGRSSLLTASPGSLPSLSLSPTPSPGSHSQRSVAPNASAAALPPKRVLPGRAPQRGTLPVCRCCPRTGEKNTHTRWSSSPHCPVRGSRSSLPCSPPARKTASRRTPPSERRARQASRHVNRRHWSGKDTVALQSIE